MILRPIELPDLVHGNGRGGFTHDGREYVIVLEGDAETPLPWANVMANPRFGTQRFWFGQCPDQRVSVGEDLQRPSIQSSASASLMACHQSSPAGTSGSFRARPNGSMSRSAARGRAILGNGWRPARDG